MNKIEEIIKKIDELRTELYKLIEVEGLDAYRTKKINDMLDKVINDYYKLMKDESEKK